MTQSTGELQRENVALTNEVSALKRQAAELEQALRDQQALAAKIQSDREDLRIEVRALQLMCQRQAQEIRGYIEQDVVAGGKYKTRLEAATQELRLITKARLTSGCGCPIGTCLNYKNSILEGACWVQWAEAYVMKRQGELQIDAIRSQANHPARIAAADRSRENTTARRAEAESGDNKA